MKLFGMEIVEDATVPPGEVWIVQPERRRIWGSDGKRTIAWSEPAKVLGRIINLEEPE